MREFYAKEVKAQAPSRVHIFYSLRDRNDWIKENPDTRQSMQTQEIYEYKANKHRITKYGNKRDNRPKKGCYPVEV